MCSFYSIFHQKVTKQDQLPKRICLECRLMLEKSFLFRNKCKNSDSKLRRHIRLINAGKGFYFLPNFEINLNNRFSSNSNLIFFPPLIAVSHVFDDSEDEYEDDYTESIKLINDLDMKIQQKRKLNEKLHETNQVAVATAAQAMQGKSNAFGNQMPNQYRAKNLNTTPEATQTTSNSAVRTRTSNRLRNTTAENKFTEASIIYDGQTIEVLMEDIGGGGQETEYIISDTLGNPLVEQFHPDDSNDEEFEALMANTENHFETDPFALQNVTKTEELYISEESTDDNKNTDDDDDDDDDTGNI